jgi:nucleoside-diphosphate-sugar epimerase
MTANRVLVTGGSGFIGRHCLPLLVDLGYEIHAVKSRSVAAEHGVTWHATDLLAPAATRELVARVRPTHVLHLAWFATPGAYATSLVNLQWAAAGPTLMAALIEYGVRRVVAIGTCAEYDWTSGPCDEQSTPLMPTTLYASCKHAWRVAYEAMARSSGVPAAWARIFLLYGPGEHPKRLVPSVIQPLLRGEVAELSAATQVRDFLYVKDVASALVALLDSPVVGSVNIGSGHGSTVRDLALTIATQIGRPDLVRFGEPTQEPPQLIAATTRLFDEVGWRPQYDLTTGMSETIAWWRTHS